MPAASTAVRYEAARPPPKEQILVVDAWGYTPPPPPDPAEDAADELIREAVALAARDASIDALAAPQSHPQRIRRPPPTAFVDPLAAAKAAAADAAAAEDERLDHLDGFSDEGGDGDDVTVEEEDAPEDFAGEAAAADAVAADARRGDADGAKTAGAARAARAAAAERAGEADAAARRQGERRGPRVEPGSAGGSRTRRTRRRRCAPFDDEAACLNAAVVCGAPPRDARMCSRRARPLARRRPLGGGTKRGLH